MRKVFGAVKSLDRGSVRTTGACLALALLVASCTSPSGPTTAATPSAAAVSAASSAPTAATGPIGTITERVAGDWGTLDPNLAIDEISLQVIEATYDRLVALSPDGTVLPYIAKSWSGTSSEVTFALRTDAKCADGTPLTPTAVANSFNRWFAPETKSPPSILQRFFGPGPYAASASDAAGTLTFKLGTPFNELVTGLVSPYASIICPAGLADPKSLEQGTRGSGPFTIESANHGDTMKLKARRDWNWGPNGAKAESAGFPDSLVYRIAANETTAANLLLTGGLDVAKIEGPDVTRLTADTSFVRKEAEAFPSDHIRFNEDQGPGADRTIREALLTSIDVAAFLKATGTPGLSVSTSVFGPRMTCYDPTTKDLLPKTDPERSKQLLRTAGYTAGSDGKLAKDGKPLVIKLVGTLGRGSGPDYIAEQVRSLGATVNLTVPDQAGYARASATGDYDMLITNYFAPVPTPSYGSLASAGRPGTRFNDPQLQPEVTAAQRSPLEGPERCQHWANFQRRLLTEFHVLPTARWKFNWFGRSVDFEPSTTFVEPWSIHRK